MYDTRDFASIHAVWSYVTITPMRRTPMWSLLVLLPACEARISDASHDGSRGGDDAMVIDAGIDALRLGPWSTPARVAAASTPEVEDDVTLSSDALEMIFAVEALGGNQEDPWLSPDGRTFAFASDKDIFLSTR